MVRLLHISDLHFGTEVPRVVDAFWRAFPQIRPSLVVCTGDVTQRAHKSQFRRARSFFDKFAPVPHIVVPGNHDVPLWNLYRRLTRPYLDYQQALGTLEQVYSTDGLLLTAINTTRHYHHKNGAISREQVEQVRAAGQAAHPKQLRVVVGHHPLFIKANSERHNQVGGGAWAGKVWSEAGVDLVLGGHIHLPYFARFPLGHQADGRGLWVVQAGTTVSERVRDEHPNSFNVIEWDGSRCQLTRWDFRTPSGPFAAAESTELFCR